MKEPDEVEKFDGDLSVIPTKVKEISKLPVFKLKQFLHFYGIPWSGNKDQLVLRVLAPRMGMTHLLFRGERDGILELIATAEQLISAQKEIKILCNEFVVRQRAFPTPEGKCLSGLKSHQERTIELPKLAYPFT